MVIQFLLAELRSLLTSSGVIALELLLKFWRIYVNTDAACSSDKKPCAGIRLLKTFPFIVTGCSSPYSNIPISRFLSPFTHSELSSGGNLLPSPLPSIWWQDTQ